MTSALAGARIGPGLRRTGAVGRAVRLGGRPGRLSFPRRGPLVLVLDLPIRRAAGRRGLWGLAGDRGHGRVTPDPGLRSWRIRAWSARKHRHEPRPPTPPTGSKRREPAKPQRAACPPGATLL